MPHSERLDVVVVGAGPAGLNAALVLGRCRRRVLVVDSGRPRNRASRGVHGFLTRDGALPEDLLRLGREQLVPYSTVRLEDGEVADARTRPGGFEVVLADDRVYHCRKLLLATGVADTLPQVPGFEALYGRSAFHCPYCDGWEMRDRPVAVLARGPRGEGLALELLAWTRDVALCTDGPARLTRQHRERLGRHGIPVHESRIARLEGQDGRLDRIVFTDGRMLARRAVFFGLGQRQASDLPARLGCEFTRKGAVKTGRHESTNVPGLYVAGDASELVQMAIVAAGEGAQAAFAINTALLQEDLAAAEAAAGSPD